MNYLLLVFGFLMLFVGVVILIKPMAVFGVMSTHSKSLKLHVFAVVVRLVLGVTLLTYAQNSKFPLTLEIMGVLSIAAAIALSLIGRNRFMNLIQWAMTLIPSYGRVIGVFAMLFGGFIGYAVF